MKGSRLAILSAVLASAALVARASQSGPPVSGPSPAPGGLAAAADQFFTQGDVTLRYREIGRGEPVPVVLLHGFTAHLEDWNGIADALASDHRVIALDLRGFGKSSQFKDSRRYGLLMADDVIRLMDHLRIESANLVGHSMGALIAANIAARYPARVATVTLIAGPFYRDSAAMTAATAPWTRSLEQAKGLPGVSPEANAGMMAHNDPAVLVAVLRSFGNLLVGRDGASKSPALVAVGTTDSLLPLSRDLASWWPGARLIEVAGADHVSVLDRLELLTAMRNFLPPRAKKADRLPSRGPALVRAAA